VAVLVDATAPEHKAVLADLQAAAASLGLTLNAARVQRYTEVEGALAAMRKRGERMLVVAPSTMFAHAWIADLAMKAGLALASTAAGYVYEGGLMAYTNDWESVFDRAATFVDRILKGAKPAELPIELPTRFRLIVNSRTASALGLAVPPGVMLRATQVIQ
jgi:putative ABC transport system substrate-binding protein